MPSARSMPSLVLLSLVFASSACPSDDPPAGDDTTDSATSATDGATEDTASTADETAGTTTANDTMDPTAGLSGEELFAQLCSPCHGPQGEGVAMLGYELQHPVREHSTWVARNGRPGDEFASSSMSAYSTGVVSDVQLEEIWDYLDGFPQPTTGEGLYLDYCRNCHGVDARGGVVNKDISDKAFNDAQERVRVGAGLGNPGGRLTYMPAFGTDVISDAELQLIVDYIASI